MNHDGELMVAVGRRADTKKWTNKKMTWGELSARITTEYHTHETLEEYSTMSKDDQARIKDVGGFVGGHLKEGRRLNRNVDFRQVLCLDLDDARLTAFTELVKAYPVAAAVYSTHKHTTKKPRLRLVLPLSRKCSPEEYEAVGRRVGETIGMEMCDPSTFQPARLMYWPSTSKDGEFMAGINDAPWLDVDAVLATYYDWRDTSAWPRSVKEAVKVKREHDRAEDPTTKKGVVGAFCRVFTVTRAIDNLLADAYTPTEMDDRYTYVGGSTSAGLVIYDDLWAYSNHSTDPAGQRLSNAFDLVRLHKFGHLDEKDEEGKAAPSFRRMVEWASDLPEVKAELVAASVSDARMEFADEAVPDGDDEDKEWMKELDLDKDNRTVKSVSQNFSLIFDNDPRLKDKFRYNAFKCRDYVTGTLPWRTVSDWTLLEDIDLAGLRSYLEEVYGMSAPNKLDDALTLVVHRKKYHPVKDYLNSLKWDGVPRIDMLLIDYLGAKDSVYARQVARKMLVGAVARIMHPGVKFDQTTVLVGITGCGKSTLCKKLAGEWFSDSFAGVQGNAAFEALQGRWIMEIGELAGLKKADVEPIKQFLTKTEDEFRPAYAKKIACFKRQIIFIGTTNSKRFLRDVTGNRRFYPVDVTFGRKNLFGDDSELDRDRDQMWAEAVAAFKAKESLLVSAEAERLADIEREEHMELDERTGLIEGFLDLPLPLNWDEMGTNARRRYIMDYSDPLGVAGTVERQVVCLAEIWCECFGKDADGLTKYTTRDVGEALALVRGWEPGDGIREFPLYGKQRFYVRINNDLD